MYLAGGTGRKQISERPVLIASQKGVVQSNWDKGVLGRKSENAFFLTIPPKTSIKVALILLKPLFLGPTATVPGKTRQLPPNPKGQVFYDLLNCPAKDFTLSRQFAV